MTKNTQGSSVTPPATRHKKKWRIWLSILGALLTLLTVLMLVAVQSEWSARLLWKMTTRTLTGQLSGEFVGGSLIDGVKLRNVTYRSKAMLIQIDTLESRWQLLRAPLTWRVHEIRMGDTHVHLLPTTPTPLALPRSITLPLGVELRNVTLQSLVIHQGAATTRYSSIRLQAETDGVQHTLKLISADTPYGAVNAAFNLNGTLPFALNGNVSLNGMQLEQAYRIDTRLSGTLRTLAIQINATGDQLTGHASIDVTPFSNVPFRRAQIDMRHVNPKSLNPEWPRADLHLHAALIPAAGSKAAPELLTIVGSLAISNALAGTIDQGLLPLVSASAEVVLNENTQQLSQISIVLPGSASLQGNADFRNKRTGQFTLQAHALNLQAMYSKLKPTQLNGPFTVALEGDQQKIDLKLADKSFSVIAQATVDRKKITLQRAQLQSGPAQLTLSGTLGREPDAAYAAIGKLTNFNPALFFTSLPRSSGNKPLSARINTDFEMHGTLTPELRAAVQFKVRDSDYDHLPMTGGGTIVFADQRLLPSDAQLTIAGNSLKMKGGFGAATDRLVLDINAPSLNRLGFGLSGLLRIKGNIGGTLTRPVLDATYHAEKLVFGAHRLAHLSGMAQTQGVPGTTPDARFKIDLSAGGLHSGEIQLTQFKTLISGSYAKHAISIHASGRVREEILDLTLTAQGRLQQQAQGMAWDGILQTLENRGLPRLSMSAPLTLAVSPGRITLGATRLTVEQAVIDLKGLRYDASTIRSEGAFSALDVNRMLKLWQKFGGRTVPFNTDLMIDGRWNITLAERADGYVQIERRSGDVRFFGDSALGLSVLTIRANLQDRRIMFDAQAKASRVGSIDSQGQINLQRTGARLTLSPQSPVSGKLNATIPNLQSIASLTGPRIALDGNAEINLTVKGTLDHPIFSGTVSGDRLALTLYDQGVHLHDGTARLNLNNNIINIEQLEFHGGDGSLRATGSIPLNQVGTGLSASIVADKLQLMANPSGQLTLSGQASATNPGGQLQVTGKFTVDRARFTLPEKTAPQLSDDVVVIHGGKSKKVTLNADGTRTAKPAGPYTPRINIALDLGSDFRFEGSGANLLLGGTLVLKSEPGMTPQAYGTVQVVSGSYEAFGTKLAIERGIINFQGALDNPNVNIVAMRRKQDVAAGVLVTGNVRRPRVQLTSEPNLPQEEQLSWLVFGRSGGGGEAGQAQAAVAGATLGLLNKFGSGRTAKAFGLDTLAIGESEFGLGTAQVVNLGKSISDRLYVGYEQSLLGAESVLKLTYAMSQFWSVVLRGGTVTGVEVLYNKRFDKLR